jgi:predicted enzyme related to lactoylglutathione lyase
VENPGDGHGSIHWTECMSTDVESDLAWLEGTFGYAVDEMPMPQGTYYVLRNGDQMCGGLLAAPVEGMPSAWMTWVQVDDVDAVAAKVSANGGQLHGEMMDMEGIGRLVTVADPTGGAFGIITPPRS